MKLTQQLHRVFIAIVVKISIDLHILPAYATPIISTVPPNLLSDQTGNTTVSGTTEFGSGVQALNTTLAVLCVGLITSTYAVLIGPGARLLSTSKLPIAAIEADIGNLLSSTWPDMSTASGVGAIQNQNQRPDAIRLLYAGKLDQDQQRAARGVEQCVAKPTNRFIKPPMWLTTGSPLTNSVVQLAVWEWVSIWMGLAMLVSTLGFNGFLTKDEGPDSYPRLVIVLIYIASICLHFWYVWKKFKSFFTMVAAGASWSLLNRASFVSVSLRQLDHRLVEHGDSPIFRQVGKPSTSSTFPVSPVLLQQDVGKVQVATEEQLSDMQRSEGTIADWQKRDISSCVNAGSSALASVILHVTTIVGITITTGFSVWTTRTESTVQTTESQLGSLALLASLTVGAGAMFTSAIHLNVMDAAFKNVLFLKEVMINGESSSHISKRVLKRRVMGFTHNSIKFETVRMTDLMKLSNFWSLVIFGPAYTMLPSVAEHERQSVGLEFEFCVQVRGRRVVFTTSMTDRHAKSEEVSVEAINVCYDDSGRNPEPVISVPSSSGEVGKNSTPEPK